VTIKRDINKLIPPKARGKKRLALLAGSRSIGASRGLGKPGGKSAAVFTERSRAFHNALRELRSSDDLFVLEFRNVAQITMVDQTIFKYIDYNPDA
jgi:hypothetical protein